MNLRQHLTEIIDFLQPYQTIWQNEIMLRYPDPLKDYPQEWVKDLLRFEERDQLIKLDRKQVEGLIENPSLVRFYERRKELIDIPFARDYPQLPEDSFTFLYMTPKKQYEIRKLAPMVQELYHRLGVDQVIDIGGGIGCLAQTLVNQYQLKVCSVDLDPVMQKTGLDRHHKNAKNPENLVHYRKVKVEPDSTEFISLLDENKLTLGLHTCGALAVTQLQASSRKGVKGLINFGCCYHKMEHDPQAQNISRFVQERGPLELSRYALTLASRAHLKLPEKDFDFKLKVKHFRYAIHFLLQDHYGFLGNVTLGNSKHELYDEPFSTYALEQLCRLNVPARHSKEELDDYFRDQGRQELIRHMLAAGIIRDAFGRLLELYILLDRAVFLEEQGYEVELFQCFDEAISPRNLGLFSHSRASLKDQSWNK